MHCKEHFHAPLPPVPEQTLTDKACTMICSGEAGAAAAVSVMVGLVVRVKGRPWLELVCSK